MEKQLSADLTIRVGLGSYLAALDLQFVRMCMYCLWLTRVRDTCLLLSSRFLVQNERATFGLQMHQSKHNVPLLN